MSTTSFQCPDSGLIVIVRKTRGGFKVEGDEYDWSEMTEGLDEEGKSQCYGATREWIARAQRAANGKKTVDSLIRAFTPLGVEADDLWPLEW